MCDHTDEFEYHHIERISDAPMFICDPGNVVLLCSACHRRIKGKEKRYRKLFYGMIAIAALKNPKEPSLKFSLSEPVPF